MMLRWFILRDALRPAPSATVETLRYWRTLAIAKYRASLARRDLHAQLDYVKNLRRELEAAERAIPVCAKALAHRLKDVQAVHTERRSPVSHITSRPLKGR